MPNSTDLTIRSDFASGIDAPFIPINTKTRAIITGGFILFPSREELAYQALFFFYEHLPPEDTRREPLLEALKRREAQWQTGLIDIY